MGQPEGHHRDFDAIGNASVDLALQLNEDVFGHKASFPPVR